MMKRIFLFALTNLLVITTISIVINFLGIKPYLTSKGINYESLLIFCSIWGMGGAFISLLMSKWMAKNMMGLRLLNTDSTDPFERSLLDKIKQLSERAGLSSLPEVGIYEGVEMNAFATGPSQNHALVAVSTGLLHSMNDKQIEAVLGHEISHIKNGDMVTLTLIQGIINAFAMFLSRLVAYLISMTMNRNENEEGPGVSFFILSIIFDIFFTLLGSLVVAAFSRWREYRADRGGAHLAGKENMISALKKLAEPLAQEAESTEVASSRALEAFKISSRSKWLGLFSTHPPLALRIAHLEKLT